MRWSELVGPRVARQKRGTEEQDLCVAFMAWVRLSSKLWPELEFIFHVPNGGGRSKREGGILKAMGVKPGVADYILPIARGGHPALWLEAKSKDGVLSPAQKDLFPKMAAQGMHIVVCYTLDQMIHAVTAYLTLAPSSWVGDMKARAKH